MGHVARHIGRFKNKFIVVQANQSYVNIYRDDISKVDPFQTLPIDAPLSCSIQFHDFLLLGGNDGDFGTILVLKPRYNHNSVDVMLVAAGKSTAFGAIQTLCAMT